MILGLDKLLERVKSQGLVSGLAEREITAPEGAGFDLRLGALYELTTAGFLGVDHRETPSARCIAKYEPDRLVEVSLAPSKYHLLTTVESVKLPLDIVALVTPRTTLFRSGILVLTAACSPGYEGCLTFGIVNLSERPFRIQMGARVAQVHFFQVDGETRPYRGQWQGGRVSSEGKELQI